VEISQYAATWRNVEQEIVATVYGGTACQAPRDPRSLAAITEDGGYEAVLRCRDCEGCRRYEKQLLQRRLAEHFRDWKGELWTITLTGRDHRAGLSKLIFSHMLRYPSCVGMIRRGLSGLVFIATAKLRLHPVWLSTRGLRVTAKRLEPKKGGRAFADCASGLMTPRSEYGRQTNRWYIRGLKPLPNESFVVERKGGIRKRHPDAKQGLRAWRDGFTLYASQRTNVIEWLAAMRSWRSQRLEPSLPNRAPRGARRPSSSTGSDGVAAVPSPSSYTSDSPGAASGRRARAASSFLRDQTEISQAGRDASSQSGLPAWAADFVARMTALAKKRGP
jgi:hypothetical protein